MPPTSPDPTNRPRRRHDNTRSDPGNAPDGPLRGALDRALPHSAEAERALLGSMLLEKDVIGDVVTILEPVGGSDAFFNEHHRLLYKTLTRLFFEDKLVDDVVLKNELEREGLFERLGGYEFLTRLATSVGSAMRAAHYARIVQEKHLLRQLITASHRVMEAAFEDAQPPQQTMDFAEQQIFDVTERRVTGGAAPMSALVKEVFEQIKNRGDKLLTGEPTGIIAFDEITCGLQPSELIIIAARPSMGKTTLGLTLAEHMAVIENRPVLFFSLEMSRHTLAERLLCSLSRVDSQRLRRGRLNAGEIARLHDAEGLLTAAPLFVDDTSNLSILELRARARLAFRKHRIRAVFVDYLQLMSAPGAESRQAEVAGISRGLKALAKDLAIPVIALAQLNRNPEDRGRKGNKPRMSDLRESGAIEQDADVVALLHRDDYFQAHADDDSDQPLEAPLSELIIAKQRNGPTGTIKLHFNKECARFDNPSSSVDSAYAESRFEPRVVPYDFGGPTPGAPF